jgi:hypothetical protein
MVAPSVKTVQFKMAHAVTTKKTLAANDLFDEMEGAWEATMSLLVSR